MNLYKYHKDPKSLHNYDKMLDTNWRVLRSAIADSGHIPTKQQLKFIGSNADSALWYTNETGKPFPEGEKVIAQSPAAALWYAKHFFSKVNEGWPPGEEAIATNADLSVQYAKYVLGGRFLKGEPVIAKSGYHSVRYARDVIGGKWPEGEDAIREDIHNTLQYNNFLIDKGYNEDELI